MYYHVASQCYYFYNTDKQKFDVYATQLQKNNIWKNEVLKQRAENLFGKFSVTQFTEDQIIITELLLDLTEKCSIYSKKETPYQRYAFNNDFSFSNSEDYYFFEEVFVFNFFFYLEAFFF